MKKQQKNDVFEAFFNVVKKKSLKNKNKKLTVFELFSRREKKTKHIFFYFFQVFLYQSTPTSQLLATSHYVHQF